MPRVRLDCGRNDALKNLNVDFIKCFTESTVLPAVTATG